MFGAGRQSAFAGFFLPTYIAKETESDVSTASKSDGEVNCRVNVDHVWSRSRPD